MTDESLNQLLICTLNFQDLTVLNCIRYTLGIDFCKTIEIVSDSNGTSDPMDIIFTTQNSATSTDDSAYIILLDLSRSDSFEIWQKKFESPLFTNWVLDSSSVLLSSDLLSLRIFLAYKNTLHYFVLDKTDGSLIGNFYESASWTASSVSGSAEIDNFIYVSLKCSTTYVIFQYGLLTNTFSKYYKPASTSTYITKMIQGDNWMYFIGYSSAIGYKQCFVQKVHDMSSFNNDAYYIMSSLYTGSPYTVTLKTISLYALDDSTTIGVAESITINGYINDTVTGRVYIVDSSRTQLSDIAYYDDTTYYLRVSENNAFSILVDLRWSITGDTSISFSTSSMPTWIGKVQQSNC